MQSFLTAPKFNKVFFYKEPQDLYQEFCNAFAYYKQAVLCDPKPNRQKLMQECVAAWKQAKHQDKSLIYDKINEYFNTVSSHTRFHQSFFIRHNVANSNSSRIPLLSSPPTLRNTSSSQQILPKNAVAQRTAMEKIETATKNLLEYERMYSLTTNEHLKESLESNITDERNLIKDQEIRLEKLKCHADAQAKLVAKKAKLLEEGIIEKYDGPGRPSAAMCYSDFWDKIHSCVEFGAAHTKRRKTIIKVRTIKHLRQALEEKYNIYLSRQCLSTYLEPRHSHTFAARHHHHPAKIGLASIARTEMKSHTDEHYCLASVKAARIFAEVFADETIIISQDDKAKIGLGIPAVGRTFKTMQTVSEPVSIEDHDFPTGSKMKLIPSVYLVIDPVDSNDALRSGQLAIFVRPEYFVGTTSSTHMSDLQSIVANQHFVRALTKNGQVRPIWVLLVDGGPDENPRHMKNIIEYCKLFRSLNLDYLTVRTHAPGQSAYNPVERSMASLSTKLAGITLPVDKFGSHLDSQGKVVDDELARRNFEFSGKSLCDLWKRDEIYGKPVIVEYVD